MSTASYPSHRHPNQTDLRHTGEARPGLLRGPRKAWALGILGLALATGYAHENHTYNERLANKQVAALRSSTEISKAKYLFGPGTKLHSVPSMFGAKFGFTLKNSETRTLKPKEVLAMEQPLIHEDPTGHIWVGASPKDKTSGLPLQARAEQTVWADTTSLMAPINQGQMKIIDATHGDDVGSIRIHVNEAGQIIADRQSTSTAGAQQPQVIPGAATFTDKQVK